jgi:hypothetical protein
MDEDKRKLLLYLPDDTVTEKHAKLNTGFYRFVHVNILHVTFTENYLFWVLWITLIFRQVEPSQLVQLIFDLTSKEVLKEDVAEVHRGKD